MPYLIFYFSLALILVYFTFNKLKYIINMDLSDSITTIVKKLSESYKTILKAYNYIDRETKSKEDIIPASEWLMDNFYLIEKEYKELKNIVSKSHDLRLPVITKETGSVVPRIFELAISIIDKCQGTLDETILNSSLKEFQENYVLTSRELWALPIMLRIALINKISVISEDMMKAMKEKKEADKISEEILRISDDGEIALKQLNASFENIDFTVYFTERLLKILRDSGIENPEIYKFINEKLQLKDKSNEKMIVASLKLEAAMQHGLGNCIKVMRVIEAINWKKLFEANSILEETLASDPAGIYSEMEFKSREYYRNKIEELAGKLKISEVYIAKKAIECASEAGSSDDYEYKKHVGYYIVDEGLALLLARTGHSNGTLANKRNFSMKNKVQTYITAISIMTVFITCLFSLMNNVSNYYILTLENVFAILILIIPSSEIVTSLINWSVTQLKKPKIMPKLEFKSEIPEQFTTAVVIPTFIKDESNIKTLLEALEVYYLANSQKNIYFVLLADLKDSNLEICDSDNRLIEFAMSETEVLNKKYCAEGSSKFYFLCRKRTYNTSEKLWMGWERKRGKLQEFNNFVRGQNNSFKYLSLDATVLYNVKFVITLDADTELLRGTAARLIGTIAHPLNRAFITKRGKCEVVGRGYGVLQPRISVNLTSFARTYFSKIFSCENGMDTYTNAVSDVYQDLFDEGSFTGKGIYEVDIFSSVMKDRVKENTLLSHDLLEGCYARAGLVSDIQLMDGYPAYYNSNVKRTHRWIRGDWQLLPWLLDLNNCLTLLCRWKILDNLRRSLVPLSELILLLTSLFITDNNSGFVFAALIAVACPIVFNLSESVVEPLRGIQLVERYKSFKLVCIRVILVISFMPYQSIISIDAIIRALFRMCFSKKKLLEWETAADVEYRTEKNVGAFIKQMWTGSAIGFIVLIYSFFKFNHSYIALIALAILWIISPIIGWYISVDMQKPVPILTEAKNLYIRRISRKTWAYFEDFENSNNKWLAPDNFQEEPYAGTADRISPTNIGMTLISAICSYDLGYVGAYEAANTLERSLTGIDSLERYNGHFYNWYDLNTSKPLIPKFISTVDSGNLLGYYWTIEESLCDFLRAPLLKRERFSGLLDLALLAADELKEMKNDFDIYDESILKIKTSNKNTFGDWKKILEEFRGIVESNYYKIARSYWNMKLLNELDSDMAELDRFCSWHKLPQSDDIVLQKAIDDASNLAFTTSLSELGKSIRGIKQQLEGIEAAAEFRSMLEGCATEAEGLVELIEHLLNKIHCFAEEMDFKFLYNEDRALFSIAFDAENNQQLNCYYDLLASEARQASFLAIAKGDVEKEHWFKLGRAATVFGKHKGLISWTGTMFEYFMPQLIMKHYPGTILEETYNAVLYAQKKYSKDKGIPWGVSEAAFYSFDANKIYQYKAIGIPDLGFKRGLGEDVVIAPYATLITLPFDPLGAVENLISLQGLNMEGKYGFYDSIDFTENRLKKGDTKKAVKCFMVHHLGMGLMAIDNYVNGNTLQKRFHALPRVKATEILLQEKLQNTSVYLRKHESKVNNIKVNKQNIIARRYDSIHTEIPEVLLLSNGSLSTMITNNGSGYSKRNGIMLYRWKEDVTLDNYGMFFYIKDKTDNKLWSSSIAPCNVVPESYSVRFAENKADFERLDGDIVTHTELCISNEDDSEIRAIKLTNVGKKSKIVEVTSYMEVTLSAYKAYIVHPAFSNLFITTDFSAEGSCIIASRKPRTTDEEQHYLMQTAIVEGESIGEMEYETNRLNFIGRNKDSSLPEAIERDMPLSNSTGIVLDPIIAMRRKVKLGAGDSCKIIYITSIGTSREEVLRLALKYNATQSIHRAVELATAQTQLELKYLGIKSSQANLYQIMAARIIFLNPSFRVREEFIVGLNHGQSSLWAYGISGDLPIVLNVITKQSDLDIIRQLLKAHEYWTIKGLSVDLVILNEENSGYFQPVLDSVRDLINSSTARDKVNKNGGVFLLNAASIPLEHVSTIKAIARLVIDSENGLIITQIKKNSKGNCKDTNSSEELNTKPLNYIEEPYTNEIKELKYFNGFGGFDAVNGQYVIRLKDNKRTPLPWINVIAREKFGFTLSESGSSCTWNQNSRENKITTWSNDWVTDQGEEYLYLRDEVDGYIWSVTPEPIRSSTEYTIYHGFGYSTFHCYQRGIVCDETIFAGMKDNIKICKLVVKNNTNIKRTISATYYCQLVLGVVPQLTSQYIFTGLNFDEGYIFAANNYSDAFRNQKTFLKIFGGKDASFTGNRSEFFGCGGSIKKPKSLKMVKYSNNTGGGYDPCLCERVVLEIKPGEEKSIVILLGQCHDNSSIEDLCASYDSPAKVIEELELVKAFWNRQLQVLKVKTPDESMNLMLNGWLLYQTLSCRMWGKTAFYQSGGAFGFRDQLQDSIALLYSSPEYTRAQIIISASRQFLEGDVQHWWHPVVNSGIRTRFSDDLLWLPYVVAKYLSATGDYGLLGELVPFLRGDELQEGEDEKYFVAEQSEELGTIYDHCKRAIERSLDFGSHNLPLIGSGDWNDGMNTVGNKGKGESIWLGWFLYKLLKDFLNVVIFEKDYETAEKYRCKMEVLKNSLNSEGWDGSWYRRAYFDDGVPLGSSENEECQIDSLAQSWAVISGAGDEEKILKSMEALSKYLIKYDKGMILLLTPAFNKTNLEPGYIKSYVPGVRENGGQYTHAAVWVVLAKALMGDSDKAWELFHMINPINHSKTQFECEIYKTEPYVMAADVYSREPHCGRGGWSWYTGAAGWMYTVGVEAILGFQLKGNEGFSIKPSIPESWEGFSMEYSLENTLYRINIKKGDKYAVRVNNTLLASDIIPFYPSGEYDVEIMISIR